MSFKSGVQHSATMPSDKDVAMATLAGMKESKAWEGLFEADKKADYVAPHYCEKFDVIKNGLIVKSKIGIQMAVTSYRVTDTHGKTIRQFLGKCKTCQKTQMVGRLI